MELQTKIGICTLVWVFSAAFIDSISVNEGRGKWALQFWSTVISIAVFLILP